MPISTRYARLWHDVLNKVKKVLLYGRGGFRRCDRIRLFDGGISDSDVISHQKVEMAGVEPASKPGTQKLSTRLFCD